MADVRIVGRTSFFAPPRFVRLHGQCGSEHCEHRLLLEAEHTLFLEHRAQLLLFAVGKLSFEVGSDEKLGVHNVDCMSVNSLRFVR